MKTLKLALSFMVLAVLASAQIRITPASMQQDMRIFSKEGEDTIVFFPSEYLGYAPKINVVFPDGYEADEARFCSVYVINKEELPRAALYSSFPKEYAGKCIFVNIRFNNIPSAKALDGFLGRELLPYMEVNYKIDASENAKIILAGEGYSAPVINALPSLSGYISGFALSFYVNTAMPAGFEGASKSARVWAVGSMGNMARLQSALEAAGLKFFDNFGYKIVDNAGVNPPDLKDILNLTYLLEKDSLKPLKAKGAFSAKSASAVSEERFNFWLDITGKKGLKLNYIPASLKIAPPFLSWDYDTASFGVIYGAQPGKVKISGFAGDVLPFGVSFKITK